MTHDLELLAHAKGAPALIPQREEAGDAFFEDVPVYYPNANDPARLYPVNVNVMSPDGPPEVWVYRVAAHNYDEARDIVSHIFDGSELTIGRILVLPPLSGGYEFVTAQVRQ